MPERITKIKQASELLDQLGPLLAIAEQARLYRGEGSTIIEHNMPALSYQLPRLANVLNELDRRVTELRKDMSYRERALRAERWLRQSRKK